MNKDIIDGNKLIAEFMGYNLMEEKVWGSMPNRITLLHWRNANYKNPLYKFFEGNSEHNIYFHSSWDWLIPVVEKIEKLFEDSISVNIYDTRCTIEISTQYAMATDIHLPEEFYNTEESKIVATWKSCIDFIQWHNTLDKTSSLK